MTNSQSVSSANEQQTQNHAVIILASGLSQRLGQAKQLLSKNGKSLICHMTLLALTTQPQAIIIVIPDNSPLIASAIVKLTAQHANIHMVMNPTPETGMAHSLYLGIEELVNLDDSLINCVLIIGIDQILLDKEHLQALLAGSQRVVASSYSSLSNLSNKQDLDETTVPKTLKKDIIGLPLVIDYELLKRWQTLLAGDKGLRHLIRGLTLTNASQISIVNNYWLSYDIDTPEQLTHARAQIWLDS